MPSQETTWDQWFYVAAPFQIYLIIVMILVVYGEHGEERNPLKQFFRRISYSLERSTGYPGWAMAGTLSGLLMLASAAIGVYWDVAYHIDFGRDEALMTPSHTMIVLGLGGLVYSALIAIIFATLDDAPVGMRVGGLRVPWSAISLAALGMGGLISFPLDNMWHEAYGIDVTLWSPSHLGLIAGGSLATISVWLMIREGRGEPTLLGRVIQATALGAVLVGVSVVQGEFDFGVPQFQVLYLPILLAAAAGFALVLGRVAMGPWGAVKTVVAYLIIRGVISFLVAVPLNHTFPNFPLYIVGALAVEGVAYLLGTENRLRFALVAGAAAGTIGLAADIIWLGLLADVQASTSVLPKAALLAPVVAVGTALLAGAVTRPVPGWTVRVPAVAALAGLVVLVGALIYPLPRNVGKVDAVIRLQPVGDRANVEVELDPADAADSATAFGIVSWQGGGRVSASLREVAPGRYVSSRPVPVTGDWKSMVGLQRGDEVMAAPIYLPADPEYGEPEISALPERRTSFVRNTTILLRETKSGPMSTAVVAYSVLGGTILVWLGLFAFCAVKLSGEDEKPGPRWTLPREPAPPAPPPEPEPQLTPAGRDNGRYGLDRRSIVGTLDRE
ncbi:MAG: hypothetical protein ABR540_00380 [Acidimicrobiales bacterium]